MYNEKLRCVHEHGWCVVLMRGRERAVACAICRGRSKTRKQYPHRPTVTCLSPSARRLKPNSATFIKL